MPTTEPPVAPAPQSAANRGAAEAEFATPFGGIGWAAWAKPAEFAPVHRPDSRRSRLGTVVPPVLPGRACFLEESVRLAPNEARPVQQQARRVGRVVGVAFLADQPSQCTFKWQLSV